MGPCGSDQAQTCLEAEGELILANRGAIGKQFPKLLRRQSECRPHMMHESLAGKTLEVMVLVFKPWDPAIERTVLVNSIKLGKELLAEALPV